MEGQNGMGTQREVWTITGKMTEEERRRLHSLKFSVYPPVTMLQMIHDTTMEIVCNNVLWDRDKCVQAARQTPKPRVFVTRFSGEEMEQIIRFCMQEHIPKSSLAHYAVVLLLEGVIRI